MSFRKRVLWLEVCFFLVVPFLGGLFIFAFGPLGLVLYIALFVLWCWELFAFSHYRYCRQEEFLQVLTTAAQMQVPIESFLQAFLRDRPRNDLYRFWVGSLMFFVFPGFYWIHQRRSFDARIAWLVYLLEKGAPLDQALVEVPGVVSRETALAVTVGQFTGKLAQALQDLPGRRLSPLWAELVPRMLYPVFLLAALMANVSFLTLFVAPKFEMIFGDSHLRLPMTTQALFHANHWLMRFSWAQPLAWMVLVTLINGMLFSSRAKWYSPVLGRLYRMHVRGQFLKILGLMLETGRPLPQILHCTVDSNLLPVVLQTRTAGLAHDLEQGQALVPSLARQGLVTKSMHGLVESAEKAHNLPWALQGLGDALGQRCARITYRLSMAAFPLAVVACACLVAFVALAFFMPLIAMIDNGR
jgi:type II secretory pathway component PulF